MQPRRAPLCARRAGALGVSRGLQRMLELRDALALVFPAAFFLVQGNDLLDYQGNEYVFTLVKLFIASTTPSL